MKKATPEEALREEGHLAGLNKAVEIIDRYRAAIEGDASQGLVQRRMRIKSVEEIRASIRAHIISASPRKRA
jgi:hypothetical protein